MSVKKFKSPTVTRTKRVGRIVTRTKRGWTKLQGTIPVACSSREYVGKNLSGRLTFTNASYIEQKKVEQNGVFEAMV
jgi:hypothetical protein